MWVKWDDATGKYRKSTNQGSTWADLTIKNDIESASIIATAARIGDVKIANIELHARGSDVDGTELWANYYGYNDGITRFRNFVIGNGKGAIVASFLGASKSLLFPFSATPSLSFGDATYHFDIYKASTGMMVNYIDDSWDDARSEVQFRMRTAGTPVVALKLLGSGNAEVGNYLTSNGTYGFTIGDITDKARIKHSSGVFTFLTSANANADIQGLKGLFTAVDGYGVEVNGGQCPAVRFMTQGSDAACRNYCIVPSYNEYGDLVFMKSAAKAGNPYGGTQVFRLEQSGNMWGMRHLKLAYGQVINTGKTVVISANATNYRVWTSWPSGILIFRDSTNGGIAIFGGDYSGGWTSLLKTGNLTTLTVSNDGTGIICSTAAATVPATLYVMTLSAHVEGY